MSQSPVSRRRRVLMARQGVEEQPSITDASQELSSGSQPHPSVDGTWWTGRPLEGHPKSLMQQLREGEVVQQEQRVRDFVCRPCACHGASEDSGRSVSRFDLMLEQLPHIARVINAFDSTEIQKEVFDVLMQAYLQEVQPPAAPAGGNEHSVTETEPASELICGGSAIDDDELDEEHETGLQLDLSSDSTTRTSRQESSTAGGDSIHSFIQG